METEDNIMEYTKDIANELREMQKNITIKGIELTFEIKLKLTKGETITWD